MFLYSFLDFILSQPLRLIFVKGKEKSTQAFSTNSQNAAKIHIYLFNYSSDITGAKTNETRHRSFN